MRHLSGETLARLVDEDASRGEREHVDECPSCRDQLAALRQLKTVLSGFRAPHVKPGDRDGLERRLEEAGFFSDARPVAPTHASPIAPGGGHGYESTPRRRPWLRVAAAVLIFVGGGVAGSLLARPGRAEEGAIVLLDQDVLALIQAEESRAGWETFTVEEAEELVRLTGLWHVTALQVYGDRLGAASGSEPSVDPVERFLMLENLVMATEAAVREAPADPFMNGLHASTVAERRTALEQLSRPPRMNR